MEQKPLGRRSIPDEKWQKDGIFEGRTPDEELLQNRTRVSKTFDNEDGTRTAYFTGPVHYKDDSGAWQDIKYNITPNKSKRNAEYGYANLTNDFLTYLPTKYSDKGIIMGKEEKGYINLWCNPVMQILSPNDEMIFNNRPAEIEGNVSDRSINYENTYPGITDEYKVLDAGVEHYIHINSLEFLGAVENGKIVFTETILLPEDYKVIVDGKAQSSDFTADRFTIVANKGETFTLEPIIAYDRRFDPEAINTVRKPKIEVPPYKMAAAEEEIRQIMERWGDSYFLSLYTVHFDDGAIKVSYTIDIEWLNAPERVFPIIIDPYVFVGANNGEWVDNSDCVYNTYYEDSRCQWILLESDLSGAGLGAGTVTTYAVACFTAPLSECVNLRWRFGNTASSSYGSATFGATGTVTWGPSNYTPVATSWTNYTGMSGFDWNGSSNLQVGFSRDDVDYVTCNGSWYRWDAGTNRMVADHGDGLTDPISPSPTQYGHVPWTQITLPAPPAGPACGDTDKGTITPSRCIMQDAAYTSGTTPYWKFNATSGRTYHFSLCSNSEDSYLRIYNSSLVLVASNDDNGPFCSGSPASISWNCASSEDHYITASHYSCNPFISSGNMRYWYTDDPYAHNGSITPTASWQNAAYSLGTQPVWSFSATNGVVYDFSFCSNSEDSYLRIYNSSWTQVAFNDDNGDHCAGAPASIAWTATATATFYIAGMHFSCRGFDSNGNMAYRISPPPCTNPDISVANNSGCSPVTLTATVIDPGSGGSGLSYQWYTGSGCSGGNEIGGATNSTYNATSTGTYSCKAYRTGASSCSDCDDAVATINPAPGATTFLSHSNTTTSITWNWNAATNATSYDISYDGGAWTGNGAGLTYTKSSGITANTQHRLNVRAVNGCGTGTAMGDQWFYSSQNTPTSITFSSIVGNSITATAQGTFPNQASGSSGVYIRNSTQGTNSGLMTATTSWASGGLSCGNTYSFYAKAYNGNGDVTSEIGAYNQATTTCPGSVTLTAPFDNYRKTYNIVLEWSASPANKYHLYVDDNYNFGSLVLNVNQAADTYTISAGLTNGYTYYWKVRASNDGGVSWGSFSAIRSFTYNNGQTEADWYQNCVNQFNQGSAAGTNPPVVGTEATPPPDNGLIKLP